MRRRAITVFSLLGLWSCNGTKSPAPAAAAEAPLAAAPALPVDPEANCTDETPLVPGIPGSPGHPIASRINPNGQSELAAHMRTMLADLKAARADIEAGRPVKPMRVVHHRIRCSWPTVMKDRSPPFDAMALSYLGGISALEAAPPAEAKKAFNAALGGCRACHEKTCSSAMAAINGLPFPE
ncbi:MAG: hypothetical protein IV100_30275 [Myxococcales bacterium]|nr:hypothetical protein [Myxococcales bacterium]